MKLRFRRSVIVLRASFRNVWWEKFWSHAPASYSRCYATTCATREHSTSAPEEWCSAEAPRVYPASRTSRNPYCAAPCACRGRRPWPKCRPHWPNRNTQRRSGWFSTDIAPGSRAAAMTVVGVGGGGGNAVNRSMDAGREGIEFVVATTDLRALRMSRAAMKIQLGVKLTNGLGAGANPEVGRKAALEDSDKIIEALEGADMVFVTAGLGGGTGTGAAPIIASLASEMGALTVAVITKPVAVSGEQPMQRAERRSSELLA